MIRPFLITLLPITLSASAQHALMFELHHYGPEHGLSNRHVTALVQDDIGFIWAGSVSGLDRFDGHSFRNWSVSDGLSGGRVDILRRDAEGLIWVFSTAASNDIVTIDVLDPVEGVLQPLDKHFADLPFKPADVIRVGPQRVDGIMVIGARSPARCIIHSRNGGFKEFPLWGDRFEPLGSDRMGDIIGHLVGSQGQQRLIRLSTTGQMRVLRELERGTSVEALVTGRTAPGALYRITAPNGAVQYFDTYSEFELTAPIIAPDGDPIRRPLNFTPLDRRQLLMEGTRISDMGGRPLYDITTAHPEVSGRVKDCVVDKAGNPWLATEFGLFHVEVRGDVFERLLYTENIPAGFGVLCRGMAWRDDKLYLSTEWQGAYTITIEGDSARVSHRPAPEYWFATHVADDGSWWRGGPQVVQCDNVNGGTRSYPVPDRVWSILDKVNGGILLGGLEGMHWLDPVSGRVKPWNDPSHPELDHAHVLQLEHEKMGGIRATTSKGLYHLDDKGHVIQRLWSGAEAPLRLPFDDLHHCYTDDEGVLWLSTRGAGLIRFEPSSGRYQQYTMRNGFPNNMVYAAYEDAFAQLWIPTDGGIVRFDKTSRQSAVFTTRDGLAHDEFNRLAHTQAPDGRLFFGGLNGITAFDPKDLKGAADQAQPPLVLTGFMRYSAEQGGMMDRTAEIVRNKHIELGEDDRSIQVSFSLLTYEGTGRVLYAWRLAGVEDDWSYQHGSSIRLDRLPYGTHTLEVKARDAMGQWSQHILSVPITVRMPWHGSRLVWVGLGGLIVMLGTALAVLLRNASRRTRARQLARADVV